MDDSLNGTFFHIRKISWRLKAIFLSHWQLHVHQLYIHQCLANFLQIISPYGPHNFAQMLFTTDILESVCLEPSKIDSFIGNKYSPSSHHLQFSWTIECARNVRMLWYHSESKFLWNRTPKNCDFDVTAKMILVLFFLISCLFLFHIWTSQKIWIGVEWMWHKCWITQSINNGNWELAAFWASDILKAIFNDSAHSQAWGPSNESFKIAIIWNSLMWKNDLLCLSLISLIYITT